MDATVRHDAACADHLTHPLVFQPKLSSRGEIATLLHCTVLDRAMSGESPDDPGWAHDDLTPSARALGRFAVIGGPAPDYAHWPWYSRRLVRLAARCVLSALRFVLQRQSQFNVASVNLFCDFARRVFRMQAAQRTSLRRIELQLRERIETLEATLEGLQRELTRVKASATVKS